ncbi:MAG: response regulator [bacterium]
MYKVVLIDDEKWILKDLELLVDWSELGFEIIAQYTDSSQALAFMKKIPVDLLICDIRMPGINGIDLMEKIKNKYPDIVVIFISAYSEFSYAQKAIALGAFEYILKPTNDFELKEVLERARNYLNKNKTEKIKLKKYQKSELFLDLIEEPYNHNVALKRLNILGCKFTENSFMVFVIKNLATEFVDLYHLFQKELNLFSAEDLLYLQIADDKWVILLNFDINLFPGREHLKRLAKLAIKKELLIAISDVFTNLGEIKQYYKQAELLSYNYFIYKKNGIYYYQKYNNNYKDLSLSIKNINTQKQFKKIITELPSRIIKGKINLEELAYLYNQLSEKAEQLFNVNMDTELFDYVDIVYSFNNLDDLFKQLLKYLEESDPAFNLAESNQLVSEILKDIQENFHQDIRLQDLSDKYHINYNYLSQLFKKETGQTFTKYLVELRINKAIELFSKDLLFYEIAKKVGYDDYYHFCKIFKKHKGLSPREFKNRY